MQISMYLSHWLIHVGLRQQSSIRCTISMKGLFSNLLSKSSLSLMQSANLNTSWIKLAPSSIGISFLTTTFRFELSYNHYVGLRLLLAAFISINPLFLLISLCFKKVLGVNSFYYEFS